MTTKEFMKLRNRHIYEMFESGMRQKEIGKLVELSAQRVKHIIGEIRKERTK